MSGLLLLLFAGLAAALLFAGRRRVAASRQAEARIAALQHRARELEQQLEELPPPLREWLAVLAHELRSPLSAVIGYAELLGEGALGPLEPRAVEAVHRTRLAADQLLRLIEGAEQVFAETPQDEPAESMSSHELLTSVANALRTDAEARGTTVIVADDDVSLVTRSGDVRRCLLLAVSAAIKVSPNSTISLHAADGAAPRITLRGSQLDARRDDPDRHHGSPLTGAGLRISIARRSARLIGGSLVLDPSADGTLLRVDLPRLLD
jgi:two-component system, cell cycle sensor histidine kinase PleC